MNIKYTLVFYGALIILNLSCKKKDSCPEITELGQLTWSKETESWFPSNYFKKPFSMEFSNDSGVKKIFTLEAANNLGGPQFSFDMVCPETGEKTKVFYSKRRFDGRFISNDSIAFDFGITVWNETSPVSAVSEPDFYEFIGCSLFRLNSGSYKNIGIIDIITDLRNSELDEITNPRPNEYTFNEEIEIGGVIYKDVYSTKELDYPNANIFFQKGKGLIAFKDESGALWQLKK